MRFIVPFAPGGGADSTARAVSQKLTEALRQTVFVDNRSGAASNIGMEIAAKSPPDGYTIVLISASHSVNSAFHFKLSFDLVRGCAMLPNTSDISPLITAETAGALPL